MRLLLYGAPPQAVRVRLRLGLLAQVARKRVVLDAGGCLSGHHEGRFTNMPPSLVMELPHRAFKGSAAACGGEFCAPRRQPGSCRHQGTGRSSVYTAKPSAPSLLAGRSACTSLSCRESWRGAAAPWAMGRNRPAQTISPALSRIPRETNSVCFPALHAVTAAGAVQPAHPRRPDHNKDALARP